MGRGLEARRRQLVLNAVFAVGAFATELFTTGPVGCVAMKPQIAAPITIAVPTSAGASHAWLSRIGSCVLISTEL